MIDLDYVLRRCSKRDRERVKTYIENLESWERERGYRRRRKEREEEDLRVIVADQRRHIALLEEQLLPYLKHIEGTEQEAML